MFRNALFPELSRKKFLRVTVVAMMFAVCSHKMFPKTNKKYRTEVGRYRYLFVQYCGSGMFIPDPNFLYSGSVFFHPGSRIRIKELGISTLSEIWYLYGLFIPDPEPELLPIRDPGSWGQKGTGSRIRIRNTVFVKDFFVSISGGGSAAEAIHI